METAMASDAVTEISFDQPYMTEVVGSLNMEEERDNMMDQNPFQGFNFSYCLIPEVCAHFCIGTKQSN